MKKIAILGLHLNFGGVEQAIILQANALCQDYEVELAITYKMIKTPPFKLDPRVKIKYLTNVKPNKEEFINYLTKGKIFNVFKEGIKSLHILYLKKKTMIDYIKSCNADIIISSRIEFTKLLNNTKVQCVKIAEEHCHHNHNKKYINKLKKYTTNIDYLICVSNILREYYKKVLKYPKCITIPNGLDYYPKNTSLLLKKNLIAIGRLEPEKGFLTLIDVFKEIYKQDNSFELEIIGYGSEYDKIKNKIDEYGLEKSIKLSGFGTREYIHKRFLDMTVYMLTSIEEAFGTVLIEASSFGIPSVAFDSASGAREIIKDGYTGYLIPNRDIKKMADTVIALCKDTIKLKEFGINARKLSENYTFEVIQKKWLDFINEIV